MTPFETLAPIWLQNLMQEFGLTKEQAAGILGNLGFESGGFQKLHEIGQPEGLGGYGAAQWTGSRRVAFFSYCAANNLDWESDEANWGYLLEELYGPQAHTITQVRKTTTLEAAVFAVGYFFERPRGTTATNLPGLDGRLWYAKKALEPAPEPTPISPSDKIKAIQAVLGVKQDGALGPASLTALNAILAAAHQRQLRQR